MHWSLSQVEPVPVVMQPDNVKAIYVEESATGGLGDFIRNKGTLTFISCTFLIIYRLTLYFSMRFFSFCF